jgi:hypothetical protein
MQIEELLFYHGTGRAAAQSIIACGSRDTLFEEIGARTLGQQIRRALLHYAKLSDEEDWKLHSAFACPGMEYSSLWVPALRQLEHAEESSHFEYGHFYATLNIANAYRYSIGNPYRSEFIRSLAEALKVLDHLGDSLPPKVGTRFPLVADAIKNPSPPVVLELRGIVQDRLISEKGSADIRAELELYFCEMQEDGEVSAPSAFRVRDVTSKDIVAIHDLTGWSADEVHDSAWRPDPLMIASARHSVQEWQSSM